jgi:hypothetical protein
MGLRILRGRTRVQANGALLCASYLCLPPGHMSVPQDQHSALPCHRPHHACSICRLVSAAPFRRGIRCLQRHLAGQASAVANYGVSSNRLGHPSLSIASSRSRAVFSRTRSPTYGAQSTRSTSFTATPSNSSSVLLLLQHRLQYSHHALSSSSNQRGHCYLLLSLRYHGASFFAHTRFTRRTYCCHCYP